MIEQKTDRKIGVVIAVLIVVAIIASGTTMFMNWQKITTAENDGISVGCKQCLSKYITSVKVEQARDVYKSLQQTNKLQYLEITESCRCDCTAFC